MVVAICAAASLADPGMAQTRSIVPSPLQVATPDTAGFYLMPSATLAEVYDSNIFITTDPRWDFITRLTLGTHLGYRSTPLTILGNYSFDTEVYVRNPELDNVGQNQRGALDLKYLPDRRTQLGLNIAFARSSNPVLLAQQQGLLPVAQIQQGRQETTGFTITPNASYKFSPLWSGNAAYSYSLFTQQGGDTTTANTVTLGTSRLFGPADTGMLNYYFRAYESSAGSSISNALTVGWTHQFSPFTTVTARAGPRLTQGQLGPEVFVSVQHRLRFIELIGTYSITQAIDLEAAGPVTAHNLSGSASAQLSRFLRVTVTPSFQTSSGEGQSDIGTTHYYSVSATATYQLNRWLSAGVAYAWSLQTGTGGRIPHSLVGIGLTVAYPTRID